MSLLSTDLYSQWCSPCGAEQLFEVPPCADGHGEGCLDLACTVCGHAVVRGLHVEVELTLAVEAA